MEQATINPKNNQQEQSYHYPRPVSIRAWRADVAEALYDAGLYKVSERWLSCSEQCFVKLKPSDDARLPNAAASVFVCSANHRHEAEIYSQTCDLRICPDCARRHAARLVARYLPKMQELAHSHHRTFRFRHITFTTPYSLTDEDIRVKFLNGFKQVETVMTKLIGGKFPDWKKEQGWLITAEFGSTGLKLHYHVIHWGMYLNQADLSSAWRAATNGDAFVVDVRGFPYRGMSMEETLREVLKYAVKFFSQDPQTGEIKAIPAELMPVLARTLEKTRRIRSYGVFYNLPEPERPAHSCEQCGAPMFEIPVGYWSTFASTGFLPLEWNKQNEQPSLNLKPADKSGNYRSGAPPPEPESGAWHQKDMAFLKTIRRQDSE